MPQKPRPIQMQGPARCTQCGQQLGPWHDLAGGQEESNCIASSLGNCNWFLATITTSLFYGGVMAIVGLPHARLEAFPGIMVS